MTRNIPHLHRQVLRGLVILAAGLTLSGTPAAQTSAPSWPIAEAPGELRAVVPRADLIVVSMHDAVLRELTDALSRGGPGSAIGFCHLDATFVSQRIGKEARHCRRADERSAAQPNQCPSSVGGASRQGQRRAAGEERRRLRRRSRRSRRRAPADCRAADVRGVPRAGWTN